jgi:hypothetical protein
MEGRYQTQINYQNRKYSLQNLFSSPSQRMEPHFNSPEDDANMSPYKNYQDYVEDEERENSPHLGDE